MKKLIMSILVLMLVFNNIMVFADDYSEKRINDLESLEVADLLTDPRFKELNFDKESIEFFAKIQQMNSSEKSKLLAIKYTEVNTRGLYDEFDATWGRLTPSEKLLVIGNPVSSAIAYNCVKTANELTLQEYGWSRMGDESDAFRHTVWNTLMQKYIGGSFPAAYATAHEDYSATELNVPSYNSNGELDGYKLQDHTDMDLHNNRIGRALVKWYEYFTISHDTIVQRVHNAINDGECYYLYSY